MLRSPTHERPIIPVVLGDKVLLEVAPTTLSLRRAVIIGAEAYARGPENILAEEWTLAASDIAKAIGHPLGTVAPTFPALSEDGEAVPRDHPAGATARPSTAITTDAWTDIDELEHALYADAVAQFIIDDRTRAPLTIGIKAPWGAGKTSMMRMIRKRLDPHAPHGGSDPPVGDSRLTIFQVLRKTWRKTPAEAAHGLEPKPHKSNARRTTIWFNAWKYQSGEQLWAGLAHALLSQASDRLTALDRDQLWASVHVRRLQLPALRHSLYRYLVLSVLPYAIVVPIVLIGVFVVWQVNPDLLGGASIVGGAVAAITAAVGLVRSVSDEVTKATPDLVEEPDYDSRLGFLHLVDSDMRRILKIAGATPQQPFVVFIDDLDRCSYTTVAQVIEAPNVFLAGDFDNCIFVVAMEPDLVAAQIHVAYEKLVARLDEDTQSDLWMAIP